MKDEIKSIFTIKNILISISLIFLFLAFNEKINIFIDKNLLLKQDFSNLTFDIILILTSIISIIIIFFKVFVDRYLPTIKEIILSVIIIALFIFYKYDNNTLFNYTSINIYNTTFPYIYLVIIPLSAFLSFIVIRLILDSYKSKIIQNTTLFLDDNPISDLQDDNLEYKSIVIRLKEILLSNDYKKSFTIGLVGVWGSGKSSIIKMINSELNYNKPFHKKLIESIKGSLSEPLIINFSPYLNHKEDDIINDFFIELSDKLKKYSGELSNHIIEYSQKITNIYNSKNISDFFKSSMQSNQIPANDLYNEINKTLKSLRKKIIVFIDDLDRLNELEILQVLKLIRNTADFTNTIFVVAMDKEYIINRLKINDKILDARYIDKFFQLEIYLPELDSEKIKELFVDKLLESNLNLNNNFESDLKNALQNHNNLFNDYIKNQRDAKRIINQLIFDYPFFADEIDLNDLMNFIYFKLKFPKAIKTINDNRNVLFTISSSGDYFKLKKTTQIHQDHTFL